MDFDLILFFLMNLSLKGIEERFYELSQTETIDLLWEGLKIEDTNFRNTNF